MADAFWGTSTDLQKQTLLPSSIHSLVVKPFIQVVAKTCNEEKGTINELMSIKDCRTSIELFERLIHQCGFR